MSNISLWQISVKFFHLDKSFSFRLKFGKMAKICHSYQNLSFWPEFVILTKICHFDSNLSFWPKFVILTTISSFDKNFQIWAHSMKIEKLNWASLNRYFSRLELKWRINPINLFNKRTRRYLWFKIWFSAQFFQKSCGVNHTRPVTHLRPKFSCEKDVQEVKNRIFGSD